jgi:hypothetical protein
LDTAAGTRGRTAASPGTAPILFVGRLTIKKNFSIGFHAHFSSHAGFFPSWSIHFQALASEKSADGTKMFLLKKI